MRKLLRLTVVLFATILCSTSYAGSIQSGNYTLFYGKISGSQMLTLTKAGATSYDVDYMALGATTLDGFDGWFSFNPADPEYTFMGSTCIGAYITLNDGEYTLNIPAGKYIINGIGNEELSIAFIIENGDIKSKGTPGPGPEPEAVPGQDEEHAIALPTTDFNSYDNSGTNIAYVTFTTTKTGVAIITPSATPSVAKYKVGTGSLQTLTDGKINVTANTKYIIYYEFASAVEGGSISLSVVSPGENIEQAIELTPGVAKTFSTVTSSDWHDMLYVKFTADKTGTASFVHENLSVVKWANANNTSSFTTASGKAFEVTGGETYYCYLDFTATISGGKIKVEIEEPEVVELTINENDEDANSKIEQNYGKLVNFKSNRTLKAGKWNSLVLPFDVKVSDFEQVITIFGISEDHGVYTVTFVEQDAEFDIYAGSPALVKVSQNTQISYDNVTIYDGCIDYLYNNIPFSTAAFVGTFAPTTLNGEYYISDNMFFYADVDIPMSGFRAYIHAPEAAENNVRSFGINIEDVVETAVEEMQATGAKTATVSFDLSGKKIAVKKGIVIENGQKVMY